MSRDIKDMLDREMKKRDKEGELSYDKPDPLLIAKRYEDEYISLICASFAYGKASLIVKFLDSLDFSLFQMSEEVIKKELKNHYYRFQKSGDVIEFFITIKRLQEYDSLESIFCEGYKKERSVIDGLNSLITKIYQINSYDSRGYRFLIGKIPTSNPTSPYKRWNMFLRWMVRKDSLDMGLWSGVDKKDLIIPLDTHTFNVSLKLGLIDRKTYDFKAVMLLTKKLREFDPLDPVKYDFALYRIGQEGYL